MELDTAFLAIAFAALLMNGLLIAMSLRVPHFPPEMVLALGLAGVDMVVPLLTVAAVGYHLSTGLPIDTLPHACNVKGALDFIGIFLSMLLVSLVALFRVSRVFRRTPLHSTILLLLVFAGCFVSLVVACALRDEFRVLEDGIDCAPLAATSPLSRGVLILHSAALILFLLITVGCYLRILLSTMQTLKGTAGWWQAKRPVILRTTATIVSYVVIILPPAVLLFLEALLPITHAKALNTPIDLFLSAIPLLNPSLILFSHSIIFQQLLLSSQRLRSHFSQ